MGEIFVYIFIGFAAIILAFLIYNAMRCNHEWEEHGVRVYCKHRHCTVDAYCLICTKCGKVKVIK